MKILSILLLTITVEASASEFSIKSKFLDVSRSQIVIHHVYCEHKKRKDFCAIESLYINKDVDGSCEFTPSSWSASSDPLYTVSFDPAKKSFLVHMARTGSKKELIWKVNNSELHSYDGDKFHLVFRPIKKQNPLKCKNIDLKTHLRHM